MTLHDELQRIADRAPVADVPAATWTRARSARRRDLAVTVGGVAAVLALLAGAIAWLPDRLEPPVAGTGSLGVPDHLYAVPERMEARNNDDTWMREQVSSDLHTGIAAAAYLTRTSLPVVIDADDGDYHLLDLPDFSGNNGLLGRMGTPALSLSPDGRRLAYSYAVFGSDSDSGPIPSGVRVADLTTGDVVREIPVPGKEGTTISQIAWSPDGWWLAFAGTQLDTWTREDIGGRGEGPVLGRIPPDGTSAETKAVGGDQIPLSVDDDGTVQYENGDIHVWGSGAPDPLSLDALGRVDDRRWLVRVDGELRLALADASSEHPVGAVDPGIDDSLSIAVDLVDPAHPTIDRPAPSWPWSEERISITIGLGVAAVIAAYLGLRRLVRRYRAAR